MKVRIPSLIAVSRDRNARRKQTRSRFAVVVAIPLLLPEEFPRIPQRDSPWRLLLLLVLLSRGRPINRERCKYSPLTDLSPIATLGMLARPSATATIVDGDHERRGSVVVAGRVPFRILRRCLTAMAHARYENSARSRRRSCA